MGGVCVCVCVWVGCKCPTTYYDASRAPSVPKLCCSCFGSARTLGLVPCFLPPNNLMPKRCRGQCFILRWPCSLRSGTSRTSGSCRTRGKTPVACHESRHFLSGVLAPFKQTHRGVLMSSARRSSGWWTRSGRQAHRGCDGLGGGVMQRRSAWRLRCAAVVLEQVWMGRWALMI